MIVLDNILMGCKPGPNQRLKVADLWIELWNRLGSDERPYWPATRLAEELTARGYRIRHRRGGNRGTSLA